MSNLFVEKVEVAGDMRRGGGGGGERREKGIAADGGELVAVVERCGEWRELEF